MNKRRKKLGKPGKNLRQTRKAKESFENLRRTRKSKGKLRKATQSQDSRQVRTRAATGTGPPCANRPGKQKQTEHQDKPTKKEPRTATVTKHIVGVLPMCPLRCVLFRKNAPKAYRKTRPKAGGEGPATYHPTCLLRSSYVPAGKFVHRFFSKLFQFDLTFLSFAQLSQLFSAFLSFSQSEKGKWVAVQTSSTAEVMGACVASIAVQVYDQCLCRLASEMWKRVVFPQLKGL